MRAFLPDLCILSILSPTRVIPPPSPPALVRAQVQALTAELQGVLGASATSALRLAAAKERAEHGTQRAQRRGGSGRTRRGPCWRPRSPAQVERTHRYPSCPVSM